VRFTKLALLVFAHVLFGTSLPGAEPPRVATTVGMPAKIEQLVLPGTELEARPIEDRRTPVVLRIVNSYAHGSAFRYDIVVYGLEPGEFDLRESMRRKDGSPITDLPSIPIKIESMLPPGQIEPHQLALAQSPFLGGYRLLLIGGGLVWAAGLAAILLAGRRKRGQAVLDATKPVTLADRLRPLVEKALAGTLNQGQHAELERLLIGYWRKRLKLERCAPAEFMPLLRNHEEAGVLLLRLEDWLHRPAGAAEPVNLSALLAPYQAVAADSLEEDQIEILVSGSSPRSEGRP
jgi:hypothetical protein